MSEMTTAQVLGKYRRELIAEGFEPDVAECIASRAAFELIRTEGIGVKSDD